MARFGRQELNFRQIALLSLLSLAVGLVAACGMRFPHWTDGASSLWLATGVSLAALLRSPRRQWPVLVAASVIGTVAASLSAMHETWLLAFSRAGNNALEYCLCAWIVRRRCGPYFDLTNPRHLGWLAGTSSLTSLIKLAGSFTLVNGLKTTPDTLSVAEIISWAPTVIFGVYVLALPILAITSRSEDQTPRLDVWGLMLLLLLAGELALIFGPTAFPGIYIVMPVMMMLGWRNGLLGAGLGTLVTVIITIGLTAADFGIVGQVAGYRAQVRGSYMELFFIVAILSSLPLAIIRARQRATDEKLAEALAAAQHRATQLAASEAAARQAESAALESKVNALQSEAHALQMKERLSSIIETSSDIICTVDREGRFLEISENCAAIWGWPRAAVLGRVFLDFLPLDEQEGARRSYELSRQGRHKGSVQNHYIRPGGKLVPMSWSVTWIEKDQIAHCIGRDMTEYHALEAQAQHAQRLESLGQLTGGIAHDFNNLLQVMLSTSELLAEKLAGDASLQELAEETLSAAWRAADLTGRLLSFARRQTLVAKSTNLRELVSGMSDLLRRTLGLQVEIAISSSEGLANAVVDAAQLENAILNLCINSRDAMPEGGRLTIALTNARLEQEDLRGDEDLVPGEYVSISVSDTGIGIAPDNLLRVFEPFFTTKPVGQGSGVGLSMVFGFAKQSQGCIRISSCVGEGTTVQLYLPAVPVDATASEMTTVRGTIKGGNERILLVEDDAMVRDQIVRQLEFLGYNIATALDGHDALRLINGCDTFDLMITDVMMPGGINGWQLRQKIRDIRPAMPVLFISGFSDDAAEKDRRAVSDFLLLRKRRSDRENWTKASVVHWQPRRSRDLMAQLEGNLPPDLAEYLPTYRC
ncbi:MAG: ATP-binding protein [Steroidobacteraceae bacterium]